MRKALGVLIACFIFLIVLEGSARLYFHLTKPFNTGRVVQRPPSIRGHWRDLPYDIPLKNGTIARLQLDGGDLFSHPFTINPDSTRFSGVKKSDSEIYFFGCSFTFGVGVKDEETFVTKVGEKLNLGTHNYGVSGASPEEILARILNVKKEDVTGKSPVFLYVFIDDHLRRHQWTWPLIGAWTYAKNVYERNGTNFRSLGPYEELHPVKTLFIKWLTRTGIYRLLVKYDHVSDDPELEESFVESISLMDVHSKSLGGRFAVVLWPGSKTFSKFKDALKRRNISIIDLSEIKLKEPAYIPHDHHPTLQSHEFFAGEIAERLKSGKYE